MVLYTNDWSVLGNKRIKKWPHDPKKWDEKRPVRVTINTWRGRCPGAVHWHVSVDEEDNLYWSESEDDWVSIGGGNDGLHLSASCDTREQCVAIADHFIELVCHEGHRLVWDTDDEDADENFYDYGDDE